MSIDWKLLNELSTAALEGKVIQERRVNTDGHGEYDWKDWDGDNPMFEDDAYEYRVKPEPREFWIPDQPNDYRRVCISRQEVDQAMNEYSLPANWIRLREVLDDD